MRRVLAGDVLGARIELDADASWYLTRVLRLGLGDPVVAFDGTGREVPARIASAAGPVVLEASGPVRAARAGRALHLCVALPKGPAMDLAVRMATELGATDVWPVLAARTVATGDRADRWLRVAEAAARQCGRSDLPRFHPPATVEASLGSIPEGLDRFVATPGGDAVATDQAAAVWVGPEGGWTPDELSALIAGGCRPLSLGPWVLRADTAVAAALARLQR